MSLDYTTKLVRDERLNDISDKLEVAVQQGAERSMYQTFPTSSSSPSSVSFSIDTPSESTVIDRHILMRSTVNFKINIGPNVPVQTSVWEYGSCEAFQAFPLNSLFNTITLGLNNASVSVNTRDVLPSLLHMMDEEDLAKWEGFTPYLIDRYELYSNAVNSVNNPLGVYDRAGLNQHRTPRGVHPLDSVSIVRNPGDPAEDNNPVSQGTDDVWVISVSATFMEPLFISLFHSKYNKAGIARIKTVNLMMNIDSQLNSFWSSGLPKDAGDGFIPYTLSFDEDRAFTAPQLLMNFLVSQQTNLLPAKNIVPYVEYPKFITSQQSINTIAAGGTKSVTINNIQLGIIPDKFIIFARRPLSIKTPRDSNSFFSIESVSIQFDVQSGTLANCSKQQLWRMSVANGSKQSWTDFNGRAQIYVQGGNSQVTTCGSVLVISPSRDLNLPAYLSCGSCGQFQLQMNLTLTNLSNEEISPEVVVITANSGLCETIAGRTSTQIGLLNKELVVNTTTWEEHDAISSNEYQRMSGGALSDQISSALKYMPFIKKSLCNKSGKSRSGGDYDGSGRSGGMYKNKLEHLVM